MFLSFDLCFVFECPCLFATTFLSFVQALQVFPRGAHMVQHVWICSKARGQNKQSTGRILIYEEPDRPYFYVFRFFPKYFLGLGAGPGGWAGPVDPIFFPGPDAG